MAADKMSERLQEMQREEERAEEELHDRYIQLGKDVYEIAEKETGAINRLTDRIISLKRRIREKQGQIECGECAALNPKENLYCHRCGAALDHRASGEEENGK